MMMRAQTALVWRVFPKLLVHSLVLNSRGEWRRQSRLLSAIGEPSRVAPTHSTPLPLSELLIHWKGETMEGYSFHFRHAEFEGALEAVTGRYINAKYENALDYDAEQDIADHHRVYFDESMQYVTGVDNLQDAVAAVERCSLVHAAYQVIAVEDSYEACADTAMKNGGFQDMYTGNPHQNSTWCVRVRHYGDAATENKVKRHGERARSIQEEKKALIALKPLLLKFGGGVDLTDPDCKIYMFQGLRGKTVLARRLAEGPHVSTIAPTTRLCVTNTPLCPIAAYTMCNIAGARNGSSILDPYAGSCTTLLAAAMMAPDCLTVGIEIAHNGLVNRDDVIRDFDLRNLKRPLALLRGDSTDFMMREIARAQIGGSPFDLIVTDPPYGIRESTNYNLQDPLSELVRSIIHDRQVGKPLLRSPGGKLVAFVPCTSEQEFQDCLPSPDLLQEARLKVIDKKEQVLNDNLSRWLVSFVSTEVN